MEFTYRISEADYFAAAKLRNKSMRKTALWRIMFWLFILVCMVVVWSIISRLDTHAPAHSDTQPQISSDSSGETGISSTALISASVAANVIPICVLIFVWAFAIYFIGPWRLRKLYRKDPAVQGEITVNITPESISSRNTAGSMSQTGWNIYERWVESGNLILLVTHSRIYGIMNIAGLSDTQRAELRSIIATALPRK